MIRKMFLLRDLLRKGCSARVVVELVDTHANFAVVISVRPSFSSFFRFSSYFHQAAHHRSRIRLATPDCLAAPQCGMANGRQRTRGVQLTVGLRGAAAGLAAAAGALIWVLRRTSPESSARRRILRRLDLVAPKLAYVPALESAGVLLNGECRSPHTSELRATRR